MGGSGRDDMFRWLSPRAEPRGLYRQIAVEISPLHSVPVEMTEWCLTAIAKGCYTYLARRRTGLPVKRLVLAAGILPSVAE